jgi:hypothetical protein
LNGTVLEFEPDSDLRKNGQIPLPGAGALPRSTIETNKFPCAVITRRPDAGAAFGFFNNRGTT